MKVVVCRNCGIAMYAVVPSCLKCKQSELNYHDLYFSPSGIDLEKKVDSLTAPYKKQYANPVLSLLIIIGVCVAVAGWHEYTYHPYGFVRTTALSMNTAAQSIASSDVSATESL